MSSGSSEKVRICIDRGGTFTDVIASSDSRGDYIVKLLSVDPDNYDDAPTEGVRRVLEWYKGVPLPKGQPIETSDIEFLRMGTTVATNALLERKGQRCALLITKGHGDALDIATQARPKLFELAVKKPGVLYEKSVEIDERVVPEWKEWYTEGQTQAKDGKPLIKTPSGVVIKQLKAVDTAEVTQQLQALHDDGFRSVAIVFAHSYVFPDHEQQVAEIAKSIGFTNISASSSVQARMGFVGRGQSATADAYLTPEVRKYLQGFSKGFKGQLKDADTCHVSFMQSDGALADYEAFSGLRAILSGPAGGVVGFARTSFDALDGSPVVGFDMGGTSTDVSRFSGEYEHVFETTTAGITIQVPQLDINTVAAGGGSILTFTNQLFNVGPESAGAHPGPACYRKGGPLTVTDANLLLGRLHVDSFPKIFGPMEDQPLDYDIVREKFEALTKQINAETGSNFTPAAVACGFINVANTAMARPIRALTEQKGYRTSSHNLSSFGGAGGQHACALATQLGMHNVIVHKYSSVLSAYGMGLADVAVDISEPYIAKYASGSAAALDDRFSALRARARDQLLVQGVPEKSISYDLYLNLNYAGSNTKLMVLRPEDGDYAAAFATNHKREFAFTLESDILISDIRVRATSKTATASALSSRSPWYEELKSYEGKNSSPSQPFTRNSVFFEESDGFVDTPLYRLKDLSPGQVIQGPAILLDATQTVLLHPQNKATVLRDLVFIDVGLGPRKKLDLTVVDPIQLSIFSHRFMGIAEQMCRALEKTAVSVSIKERLDFSCALFDAGGELVANAPNVPAHLGSMQFAVQWQAERRKGELRAGDILISNLPEAGGGHLPDITIMQPVFDLNTNKIVFWLAARGHHTDIGGLEGNPSHPDTFCRQQEGVSFESVFAVRDGIFNEKELVDAFLKSGDFPNCLASRRIDHNLSDIKAQISACTIGTQQLYNLFGEYGQEATQFYMKAIRDNAENSTRSIFKNMKRDVYTATDGYDDGSVIKLKVTVDRNTGSALFDFTGTSPEISNNYNLPPSMIRSGILYCLRVMSGQDIPMNGGVIAPITIEVPPGSFLNPSPDAAVAQGNGEGSQRIAEIVFTAFDVMSGSQSSLNGTHLIYGKNTWQETICGGSSAGPGWHGQSATHVNMTNTKIGELETLETRFPAMLKEFSIRRGSGGNGKWRGGDGIRRVYEVFDDMLASTNGQRRVIEPRGAHGGEPGERGAAYHERHSMLGGLRLCKLRPTQQFPIKAGERMIVHTPGAGGWGTPEGQVNGHS